MTTTGLRLEDLTRGDYQIRHRQAREELRATGTYSPVEKIYRTKDGKQVPVLVGEP